ncbi:hypothetical protein MHJ95_03915 [Corynebacterium imitans]|uniref:hypothetical protein n=1 Tax=Corynebacterium imitans TaxID=156978 RepID=UPI001EF34F92|nr:hypothetical protein [Corynebacterium imitans]MCG7278142.1 hypothetical protein [Corynebacterium imitans]
MANEEAERTNRNTRGELDIVKLSWNHDEVRQGGYDPDALQAAIEQQLKDHDWTQPPAEVSVSDKPDQTWTIFLPASMSLATWVEDTNQARWVEFLIYMAETYLDGDEERYRSDLTWLIEASLHGA